VAWSNLANCTVSDDPESDVEDAEVIPNEGTENTPPPKKKAPKASVKRTRTVHSLCYDIHCLLVFFLFSIQAHAMWLIPRLDPRRDP
jgi:hypothetical protein